MYIKAAVTASLVTYILTDILATKRATKAADKTVANLEAKLESKQQTIQRLNTENWIWRKFEEHIGEQGLDGAYDTMQERFRKYMGAPYLK